MVELEFSDIKFESKGACYSGKLKFEEDSIMFKNSKNGKTEQISPSDIELVTWIKAIGKVGVRIFLSNGSLSRFFGFKESDQEKISKFFKTNYDLDLQQKELSIRGWNWGTAKFVGSVLNFEVNNTTAFDIALSNVSQCTTGKNEVTLEFHQNDDAPIGLMEMRFHIPSSELAGATDPVEAFQNQVVQGARVMMSVSGDAIAIFREIHCLTPRGRYDIKVFQSFFQLHGKTFDYKVPMHTVMRIFLLPHKDGRQHFLVISLDPPIKQGQTRYHFLVLSFTQDDDTSIELPFSEEEIATKYEGKITKELSGPTYEVIGKIMKFLVNKKITTPGSFKGGSGTPAISCSYKAAAGYLYPLERGIIYVHKPPVYVRFEEVSCVYFARSGGSTRSFDIEIELTSGVVHTFSSIEKGEYNTLYNFISSKKVKVKRGVGAGDKPSYVGDLEGADEEGAPDAYLERVKREGEERDDGVEEESDPDESTDEDFNPAEVNESDVADEYDSDVTHSSGCDSELGDEPKKHKEKKEKPKKPKSSSEKPRKRKKEKDSNKPKRPPSAYMLWFNDAREKIKADNPGISFTEIGKKGGELWKTISSTVKEEYEKKASKAKEEYMKAMKEYKESGGKREASSEDEAKDKKSKKLKPKSTSSASKVGIGSNYLSKEFVEDDDTSSGSDDDKKPATVDVSKRKKSDESSGDEKRPAKKTKDESDKESSTSTPATSSESEESED